MTYKLFNTSSIGPKVQDVAIVEITRSSSLEYHLRQRLHL
jgi:hypothetical protein